MDRFERILEQWSKTGQNAQINEVIKILNHYFDGYWFQREGGGSHNYFIKHPCLKMNQKIGTLGIFCIPTVKGRQVKPVYLREIIKIIRDKELYEGQSNEI